uniref:aminodeoxychorismate synthase n=1 Tax=Talaromyces marneffei PM1 TaxID=1077442 RepID=A0A093VGJ9_TALMA
MHSVAGKTPSASAPTKKDVLYVDAYDSFSNNVISMLEENLDVKVTVLTVDSEWPNGDMRGFLRGFDAVVLGPGPGHPECAADVGIMNDIWTLEGEDLLPVLGICLGFQSLCLNQGLVIKRLPCPLHGQVHQISAVDMDIFAGIQDFEVTLYHSLYASTGSETLTSPEEILNSNKFPDSENLSFLAWLTVQEEESVYRRLPMGVRHKSKPFWGFQFHPESCKSDRDACKKLLWKWWAASIEFNQTSKRNIRPISKDISTRTLQAPDVQENLSHVLDQLTADSSQTFLKHVMDTKKVTSGRDNVPFWGGFLGYFSYEMGLVGLSHPKTSPIVGSNGEDSSFAQEDETSVPDASLLWVERSIVIDNVLRTIYIQSTREADNQPGGWLETIYQKIQQFYLRTSQAVEIGYKSAALEQYSLLTSAERELVDKLLQGSTVKIPDETAYKSQIAECQEELKAGESYELCLTGETTITLPAITDARLRKLRPWLIYKKLKTYNPAAFSAYGSLGKVKIASSSPECFLIWDRTSTLEMKPMKGTVRKSPGMTLEKAKEILATTKEMAENLMIADLIRHDLYGICGSGNVHVEKLLDVEDYGRVYSMITHVKGIVDRATAKDSRHDSMAAYGLTTLQRTLPPGSMTGAPKERSCMHLDRIEGWKRGIYSGVMGYLDLGGSGSFSVLIRTAFSSSDHEDAASATKPEVWRLGAGGAVTILSTPQGEWDEMITKLRTVVSIFESSK